MDPLVFSEAEKEAFHKERFHHPDPHVQLKMEVLWLLSQGLAIPEVARLAKVSVKTVGRYLKQFQQGGIEKLKENNYVGPTSELDHHSQTLKEYFEKHPPASIKQAQADIERLTGIRRCESQVGAFLKRLGMKCRKLGHVPGKADEAKLQEQKDFIETKLNPVLDEAEAGKRKLFFVDAAHFVHGAYLCYVWCFVRMFIKTPTGRKRFNVLGALDYVTKELVTVTNLTYINSESVCVLLRTLANMYPGMPLTLVLDNASYQRCNLVQGTAKLLGIDLLFLPSYSPNLNLIERLWKFVKKECLYGKYYEKFEGFQGSIEDCLGKTGTKHRAAIQTLITRNFQVFDTQNILAA